MAVRREAIEGFYRDILGREGEGHEVEGWMNAPDESSVADMFYGSPEYTSQYGGQASWQDVGDVITPSEPPILPQQRPDESGPYTSPPIERWHPPSDPWSLANPGEMIDGVQTSRLGDLGAGALAPSSAVNNFFQQYLGRAASNDELSKWLSGSFGWGDRRNLGGIELGIRMSEEASRRRAATPGESYNPQPYTNFTPAGNDYSAFNTAREQDPGKSAKDAFAYVTNSAPPPPFGDKGALRNWFNQYVRPGFEALGHKVLSVDGDSFTYTNHEGTFTVDFAQNAGATAGSMQQRLQWGATPADAATRARYPATTGGGGASGSGGSTIGNLRNAYTQIGQQYGGPGGPGITNGPLQQMGQDPLSLLITGALANFLGAEGSTTFGGDVQNALSGIMARGGELPKDQIARRYESARELLDKGRRTMVNDMRGDLASRNLLSEPGIPQGAEIGGLERITERLAPEFSRALRDIYSDEAAKADARQMTALQLATGFSTDQARNLLAGIGEGTARQTALADIALRSLQTNMAWSQFLAQFGLQRDQVMYEMQNGNIEQMLPLLQAFLQLGQMSNAGYV